MYAVRRLIDFLSDEWVALHVLGKSGQRRHRSGTFDANSNQCGSPSTTVRDFRLFSFHRAREARRENGVVDQIYVQVIVKIRVEAVRTAWGR